MTDFDTDVLTGILRGNAEFVRRAAATPAAEHAVPVVVIEEILRGRLSVIRRAESGQSQLSVEQAYALFAEAVSDLRHMQILHYNAEAHALFTDWRQRKIRVSTHDLRIAAVCVSHSATLISRNRRDFERVPGLRVDFWD